jgi:hypothetical protein
VILRLRCRPSSKEIKDALEHAACGSPGTPVPALGLVIFVFTLCRSFAAARAAVQQLQQQIFVCSRGVVVVAQRQT